MEISAAALMGLLAAHTAARERSAPSCPPITISASLQVGYLIHLGGCHRPSCSHVNLCIFFHRVFFQERSDLYC